MRNALICAGTMLTLLLLWPILFGGAAVSTASASAASSTVTLPVPAPVTVRTPGPVRPAPAPLAALPAITPATESCRATLARARRSCAPGDAACAQSVADAYDICEVRGTWPA